MNRILRIAFALVLIAASGRAQAPEAEPPPVTIEDFKVESAPAQGGGAWLRLLTSFRSVPRWADGMTFSYSVLVERDGQYRVLTGMARYVNVKGGRSTAVLYMSPSTAERFGSPVAAQVAVTFSDEVLQTFSWKLPGREVPDDWATQFQRFPNLILPIHYTPFVATEYGKYPDLMPGR